MKHRPSPWLTEEIKQVSECKNVAKCRYKCRPTPFNWEKYVKARNQCNKVCRNAQRQYIHKSVENEDPTKVWKFLRSLGIGKQRQAFSSKDIDINLLNKHFTTSHSFDSTSKLDTLNSLSSLPCPDYSSFSLRQFTDCDVKKSIMSITSNAVGDDCISRKMIILILDEILPIISHILNHSIHAGVFPSTWKDAQVTPLPKNWSFWVTAWKPSSFSDFRPISILPFLSKVLERLVHTQLSTFLLKNRLLNPFQSGFRTGHSTTTALVNVTEDVRSGMELGKVTLLTLLDFSNAFNSVDFDILLGILRSINISPAVIDWFRSYLSGRRQRIRVEDTFSTWCEITAGVPQGGVLSPLLFAIFINSISSQLISSYHLYADDLQIYTQAPIDQLSQAVNIINTDLEMISDWSGSYGLMVNPSKTQIIVIGSSTFTNRIDWSHLPAISFDGVTLTPSDTVKNLGVLFDKNLNWGPQLQQVSRKMFAAAGSMKRLRNFLPIATKTALAQSLLLPILDYADVSYLDLTEEQLNKLERLQNFSIRFIFGLRKYDHVSEFRSRLKWLPIRLRRNAHIVSLLYNILFHPFSPPYLKERFQFLHDTHSRVLRSSESLSLAIPMHSTKFLDKSFSVHAVRLWNALPEKVKCARSSDGFKQRVKEHYLSLSL